MGRRVLKGEMKQDHKLLFEFVNKCVFQMAKRKHESSSKDLDIMDALDRKVPINLRVFITRQMAHVIDPVPGSHGLAYGFLLIVVFWAFLYCFGRGVAWLANMICWITRLWRNVRVYQLHLVRR